MRHVQRWHCRLGAELEKVLRGLRLGEISLALREHADAAAKPDCGTRELPAVNGRCATRTRVTLSTAFLVGVKPNRLSSRLPRCPLLFSGFSPVGGHLAR